MLFVKYSITIVRMLSPYFLTQNFKFNVLRMHFLIFCSWETVEEIASSDVSEATKGSLEEECLVEAIEACEAIEALQNALAK